MEIPKYFTNYCFNINRKTICSILNILLCITCAQQPNPKILHLTVFFNFKNTLFLPFLAILPKTVLVVSPEKLFIFSKHLGTILI